MRLSCLCRLLGLLTTGKLLVRPTNHNGRTNNSAAPPLSVRAVPGHDETWTGSKTPFHEWGCGRTASTRGNFIFLFLVFVHRSFACICLPISCATHSTIMRTSYLILCASPGRIVTLFLHPLRSPSHASISLTTSTRHLPSPFPYVPTSIFFFHHNIIVSLLPSLATHSNPTD